MSDWLKSFFYTRGEHSHVARISTACGHKLPTRMLCLPEGHLPASVLEVHKCLGIKNRTLLYLLVYKTGFTVWILIKTPQSVLKPERLSYFALHVLDYEAKRVGNVSLSKHDELHCELTGLIIHRVKSEHTNLLSRMLLLCWSAWICSSFPEYCLANITKQVRRNPDHITLSCMKGVLDCMQAKELREMAFCSDVILFNFPIFLSILSKTGSTGCSVLWALCFTF